MGFVGANLRKFRRVNLRLTLEAFAKDFSDFISELDENQPGLMTKTSFDLMSIQGWETERTPTTMTTLDLLHLYAKTKGYDVKFYDPNHTKFKLPRSYRSKKKR
jgi:hypothetical protein